LHLLAFFPTASGEKIHAKGTEGLFFCVYQHNLREKKIPTDFANLCKWLYNEMPSLRSSRLHLAHLCV
tara:strand:+ start:222 stop:425 length:204 start_codon:yes stop_codon:yes gene_type:complete